MAFYAYHASIPWGLVATKAGALIFNSHWVRKDDLFRLPLIRWAEAVAKVRILEAITPEGLTEGIIDRVATESYEPDRFLVPVDDALVERLDHWRDETLRFSRNDR